MTASWTCPLCHHWLERPSRALLALHAAVSHGSGTPIEEVRS